MSRARIVPQAAFVVVWLTAYGLLQWSVVRFQAVIVLGVTVAAVSLGTWLWRRTRVCLSPVALAVLMLGTVAVWLTVPMFSYVPDPARSYAVAALVVGALAVTVLVLRPVRRLAWAPAAAAGVAAAAYAVTSVIAVRWDPTPHIDVWIILQQAADGIRHGDNMYATTWVGSPGVKDSFTYLPWAAVLLAPGRWLTGDVRWAMLVWVLVGLVAVWRLGRGQWSAAYAIALILLVPGTLTQVDQAWTEPLLLAGLAWWALLVSRDRAWLAVIPLALICASKQHLALLLPVLLVWRPFGVRRTLTTGALTALLVLPWFVASPSDFVHDTVTTLLDFPPIRFANTWVLLARNELDWTPPFWLTGLVVLGVLATAIVLVRRRQPPLDELLRWLALVLLVANLFNKQAFYNQYWLSGALVALSLAAGQRGRVSDSTSARQALVKSARDVPSTDANAPSVAVSTSRSEPVEADRT